MLKTTDHIFLMDPNSGVIFFSLVYLWVWGSLVLFFSINCLSY